MSDETKPSSGDSSGLSNGLVSDSDRRVYEAARSLHSSAVKDLLSLGVCERCIFRLVSAEPFDSDLSSVSASTLRSWLEEASAAAAAASSEARVCIVCLGVLQFVFSVDAKQTLARSECGSDYAARVTELVKREGHEFDSFGLEVSVPSTVVENERAVLLYLKGKYESEGWVQSEKISVKDAVKVLVLDPLKASLGAKSDSSSFHIRLTYSKASDEAQGASETTHERKKRKTGRCFAFYAYLFICASKMHIYFISRILSGIAYPMSSYDGLYTFRTLWPPTSVRTVYIQNVPFQNCNCYVLCSSCVALVYAEEENGSTSMSENSFEKVYEPCILSVNCNKMPIFFSGRYFKYSRNVSQTRWIIDDERMGEASVEELIGGNILPACLGDSYKFHAAGREDIDVRMLGSGRPFLIEVQNSRKCPSQQSLMEIEEKINNSEKKLVGVKDLKFIGSQCWAMMREGEAEKQKQYAALVWIARPLEEKDINSIFSMKELKILQKTPVRVLHRRSPLERERTIHWMKVEKIKGSSHYFLLHLCTQAGTYIKEFVHGDLGRTTPSMGSILGCRAEIIQLDVTDVKMGDS